MYRKKRKTGLRYLFALVIMFAAFGAGMTFDTVFNDGNNEYTDNTRVTSAPDNNEDNVDYENAGVSNYTDKEAGLETGEESVEEEDNSDEDSAYYLIKRSGDHVCVFYCAEGQIIELEQTGIIYELLGPEDQKLFDEGIPLSSKEELVLLLQDFES